MLGKLIKYEWRSMRIPLIIMVCVLVGTSLLTCATLSSLSVIDQYDDLANSLLTSALILSVMLYYVGIVVCAVGIMLIIAMRFYKTCYTDQAYLTHTLPVSTKQLLASKTIMAVLSYLLIMICVAVSIFVVILTVGAALTDESLGSIFLEIGEEIAESSRYYRETYNQSLMAHIIFWIISLLIVCACSIINIIGCVSLGQLYTKHRIIGAILAYFLLKAAQQVFSRIGATIFFLAASDSDSLWSYSYLYSLSLLDLTTPMAVITLILNIAVSAGLCYASYYMMTKRLNLE